MTSGAEAKAHLAKAREFLEAAETERDLELFSAATSSAVIAAINAKDAICLRLTGRTGKGEDHNQAVVELRSAGPEGAALASTLSRLLKLKTRAQYLPASIAGSDATKAVGWAARLVEQAALTVSR